MCPVGISKCIIQAHVTRLNHDFFFKYELGVYPIQQAAKKKQVCKAQHPCILGTANSEPVGTGSTAGPANHRLSYAIHASHAHDRASQQACTTADVGMLPELQGMHLWRTGHGWL